MLKVFLALFVGWGAVMPVRAQTIQLSNQAWGVFARIVGRDFVLDGTNQHGRFTAPNAKTILFDITQPYNGSSSRMACYYLKANRRVTLLPAGGTKHDQYGCGSDFSEHNEMIVTDEGWSGDTKYRDSCGFMCGSSPAESQETGKLTQNGSVLIVAGLGKYNERTERPYRYALLSPERMFTRARNAASPRREVDAARWGVFATLNGKNFGVFNVAANGTGDPMLVYDDRSPTFFKAGLNGNNVRIEGLIADSYSATVTVAQDGWVEHWPGHTYTYTLRGDGSLLLHYAGERTTRDTILRPQGRLPTMADLQVDQRNDDAARQSIAREEERQARIREAQERQAAAEREARARIALAMIPNPGGGGSGNGGGATGGGGGDRRWAYCYSSGGAGGRSYVSKTFRMPSDWGMGGAKQSNAFRAFTESRYNAGNILVQCSFGEDQPAAATKRDSTIASFRSFSDVVFTDWAYGSER